MEYRLIRGGVLIIGSLLWDRSEIREYWRARCLDLGRARHVSLPIRYGRISASRNDTYTMVFSARCEEEEKWGQAHIVPFREPGLPNFREIVRHATALVSAEKKQVLEEVPKYFHWEWGSLGLLLNPFSERHPGLRGQEVMDLKLRWSKFFAKDFDPSPYALEPNERPVLTRKGRMRIQWPGNLEDMDFLLAAVTQPNLDAPKYPNSQAIAERMIQAGDFNYFLENQEAEIYTFQDEKILKLLPLGIKG